jgi:hypothetical protein
MGASDSSELAGEYSDSGPLPVDDEEGDAYGASNGNGDYFDYRNVHPRHGRNPFGPVTEHVSCRGRVDGRERLERTRRRDERRYYASPPLVSPASSLESLAPIDPAAAAYVLGNGAVRIPFFIIDG